MTVAEIIGALFGSGVFIGGLGHAIQHSLPALALARKHREEAALAEAARKRVEAERAKIEAESKAEKDRAWEENTGRIYRDQRADLANCEGRIAKLDAECRARDAENGRKLAQLAEDSTRREGETRKLVEALQVQLTEHSRRLAAITPPV